MASAKQIAYFANPTSIHNCKWINATAKTKKVIVVCSHEHTPPYTFLDESIKVYPVLPRYSEFNFFSRHKTLRRLRRILKEETIEIIHSMYAVPNALWADALGKTHVITTRGSDVLVDYEKLFSNPISWNQKISYPLIKSKLRKAFREADAITSTSQKQIDVIKRMGLLKANPQLIRTGVDRSLFDRGEGSAEGKKKIFSPRSMLPIYNIEILIEAIGLMADEGRYSLTLVDDYPNTKYSDHIHSLIEENNLKPYVNVLPAMNQSDMAWQYQFHDMVIMIPSSDGTPNSAIEAMLSRRPVIVGPLDYDQDIFNEGTVWKANEFNARAVVNAIRDVEVNTEAKVRNAYQTAIEKASLESALKQITKIYSTL